MAFSTQMLRVGPVYLEFFGFDSLVNAQGGKIAAIRLELST